MSFWRKIFGNGSDSEKSIDPLKQTYSKPLEEFKFWEVIEKSKNSENDLERQGAGLIWWLRHFSAEVIAGFQIRLEILEKESYTSELWCAAYLMNGGASDDGFDYFRMWVISRGEATYRNAIENPDSLADEVIDGWDYYEFENMSYAACEAFQLKFGGEEMELTELIERDSLSVINRDIEIDWDEDDPDSMKKICPRLYEKFGGA